MNSRKLTVIVSDLHMGGGAADPGEDFIYQDGKFPSFVREMISWPQGHGDIELFINGDFMEFVQVNQEAYTLRSVISWCSKSESERKLATILGGHPDVFQALKEFQDAGNAVTIVPGNHDIDLYWPAVQASLRRLAGPVAIEFGPVWFERHGGKLRIAHGNHIDPANRFKNWSDPIVPGNELRLEMCPGTLFVVKFVNWLGKSYQFANNIHPVTKLAGLLAKEDKFGFTAASWMLSRFMARHPVNFLERGAMPKTGEHLFNSIQSDDKFATEALGLYCKLHESPHTSLEDMRSALPDDDKVAEFIMDTLAVADPDTWLAWLNRAQPGTLSRDDKSGETLAIVRSSALDNKIWQEEAKKQWKAGAQVVVMGHTHVPDTYREGANIYYNTGSWTRYAGPDDLKGLKLEDLKRENDFPYVLNYVRAEETAGGFLRSEMIPVAEQKSKL